jgi:hypothetical protein
MKTVNLFIATTVLASCTVSLEDDVSAPPAANECPLGRDYVGFAGNPLSASRIDAAIGADRARVKPFSALAGEYKRVLGTEPASLAMHAATFSTPPPRWYVEPFGSAMSLYASFDVAFQGCLAMEGTQAKYAASPTTAAATAECASWAYSFWSRSAEQAELDACVNVATVHSAAEPTAPRRWAYACATMLTATAFLTY